jgi:hypothetical protein
MATGRVFPNEIDRIFNAPGGPVGRESRAVALEVAQTAQLIAERDLGNRPGDRPRTGSFARSFEVKVVGRSTEFVVQNRKPYAPALETGAAPHQISARRVSYLRFKGRDGRWRTVKSVRHPGNPAYRVLERAAIQTMNRRYGNVDIR